MRILTDKKRLLRTRHTALVLMKPSPAWQNSYMEQIDQGWHDYQHDVEQLRDPDAFGVFVARINSELSWDGSHECHVQWLIDPATQKILGRVRLKNIRVPMSDAIWQHISTKIGGHVGYSIYPASRVQSLAPLMLSLALDECFAMGLSECSYWISDTNEASIRTTLGCGAVRGVSENFTDFGRLSNFCIARRA